MLDRIQVPASLGWLGQGALEGPERPSQGLPEALGPPDPGSRDPDPGSWDPRIRAAGTRIRGVPGSPSARDP